MIRPSALVAALLAPLLCAVAGAALGANCGNGKALYEKKLGGVAVSCSQASCHDTNPAADKNHILKGAANPGAIDNALDNIPDMAGLRTGLPLTATDIDDLAEWIFFAPNCPVAAPALTAAPVSVAFGSVNVGATSAPQAVTVTNTGAASASGLTKANSNSTEFLASGTCTTATSLAVGASCTLTLSYRPSAAGPDSATYTISGAGGASVTVQMTGSGAASGPTTGQLSLPVSLAMTDQAVGTGSAPRTVGVSNVGTAPVAVASIVSSNAAEFPLGNATCATVVAGATCGFDVTFRPAATGVRSTTITLASNGSGSPQSLVVTGTGVAGTPPPTGATATLVEYYHATFDHYFVTAIADEIAKLDDGTFVGWARTGRSFKIFPNVAAGLAAVCRFFSTAFGPKSSHFYTASGSECTTVKANPNWQFEAEVFHAAVPTIDGACATGTVPVYRLYNNGRSGAPNHRFTTDLTVRTTMLAQGWLPEGFGPLGVTMCAPP